MVVGAAAEERKHTCNGLLRIGLEVCSTEVTMLMAGRLSPVIRANGFIAGSFSEATTIDLLEG